MTDKKLEDLLRKGMQAVGGVVEKAIGKAQAAKQTVSHSAVGAGTPATLELALPVAKVKDLLRQTAERMISGLIPALPERRALELGDGVGHHAPSLREHGAKMVVAAEIGGGTPNVSPDAVGKLYVLRAWVHRLPFRDHAFDFAVANLLTSYQGDLFRALKEIARVLAPGGTAVFTDFHPFGAFAKRGNARVRPADTPMRGIADYYKGARLAGLRVQDVREAFIDESIRPAFVSAEEKQAYRSLRDTPLVLGLVVKKGVEGVAA